MDTYYFATKSGLLLQGSLHKEIRQLQTRSLRRSLYNSKGEVASTKTRKTFEEARRLADLNLSNAPADSKQHKSHTAAAVSFSLRTHSFRTMGKLAQTAQCMGDTNPRKAYYTHMYRTKNCPFCPAQEEDTLHILACPNNPDLKRVSSDVWRKIRDCIHANQNKKSIPKAHAIYPFALPPPQSDVQFWTQFQNADAWSKRNSACQSVAAFPPHLGAALFAPKKLKQALAACGIPTPKTNEVARSIIIQLHDAALDVLRCRTKHLANLLHQKEFYRHFVLGQPQQLILELLQRRQADPANGPRPAQQDARDDDNRHDPPDRPAELESAEHQGEASEGELSWEMMEGVFDGD